MNAPVKELVQYVPQIKNKRWFTTVCDGGDNEGIDDQEKFKSAVAMLEYAAHHWRNPRLYHIIQTGATPATYQAVLNKFCQKLRRAGGQCEWKSCIEFDIDKGLHSHAMIVIETPGTLPSRYITTRNESGKEEVSMLRHVVRGVQIDCQDLKVRVQAPASQRLAGCIQFNQTNQELLNEAVEWCSYIFKKRSKPTSGECYKSSRPARRARCAKVNDAATPPVCWANAVSTACIPKNIRFPTTASGRKCLKTPVYAGISHLRGISDPLLSLKTYKKQCKTSDKSHFLCDFQPHAKRYQAPRHGR